METFSLFIINVIVYGIPLLYATVGEIITEKSGSLNLGVEGIMAVGAIIGYYIGSKADSLFVAMLFAFLSAAMLGLLFAFLTVTLKANQNVTGLTITTFGLGFYFFIGKAVGNNWPLLGGNLKEQYSASIFVYLGVVIAVGLLLLRVIFLFLSKIRVLAVEFAVVFCLIEVERFFLFGCFLSRRRLVADGAVVGRFFGGLLFFCDIVKGDLSGVFEGFVGVFGIGIDFCCGLRFGLFRCFGLLFGCLFVEARESHLIVFIEQEGVFFLRRLFFGGLFFLAGMQDADDDEGEDELNDRHSGKAEYADGFKEISEGIVEDEEHDGGDGADENDAGAEQIKAAGAGERKSEQGKREVDQRSPEDDAEDQFGDVCEGIFSQRNAVEQVGEGIIADKFEVREDKEAAGEQCAHGFYDAFSLIRCQREKDECCAAQNQRKANGVERDESFAVVEDCGKAAFEFGAERISESDDGCDGDDRFDEVECGGAVFAEEERDDRADEQDGIHADHDVQRNFREIRTDKFVFEKVQDLREQAGFVKWRVRDEQEYDKARENEQRKNDLQ